MATVWDCIWRIILDDSFLRGQSSNHHACYKERVCPPWQSGAFLFRFEFSIMLWFVFFFEAGRPPECNFLLIYEIEISQDITNFHHHIKT